MLLATGAHDDDDDDHEDQRAYRYTDGHGHSTLDGGLLSLASHRRSQFVVRVALGALRVAGTFTATLTASNTLVVQQPNPIDAVYAFR